MTIIARGSTRSLGQLFWQCSSGKNTSNRENDIRGRLFSGWDSHLSPHRVYSLEVIQRNTMKSQGIVLQQRKKVSITTSQNESRKKTKGLVREKEKKRSVLRLSWHSLSPWISVILRKSIWTWASLKDLHQHRNSMSLSSWEGKHQEPTGLKGTKASSSFLSQEFFKFCNLFLKEKHSRAFSFWNSKVVSLGSECKTHHTNSNDQEDTGDDWRAWKN